MTLVEFLTARLDEDEAAARAVFPLGGWSVDASKKQLALCADDGWRFARLSDGPLATHMIRHQPARVLREVEAKRAFLALFTGGKAFRGGPAQPVRLLAAVYSDHPDYREEWRP